MDYPFSICSMTTTVQKCILVYLRVLGGGLPLFLQDSYLTLSQERKLEWKKRTLSQRRGLDVC